HTRSSRDWSSDVCSSDLNRDPFDLTESGSRRQPYRCPEVAAAVDFVIIDPEIRLVPLRISFELDGKAECRAAQLGCRVEVEIVTRVSHLISASARLRNLAFAFQLGRHQLIYPRVAIHDLFARAVAQIKRDRARSKPHLRFSVIPHVVVARDQVEGAMSTLFL